MDREIKGQSKNTIGLILSKRKSLVIRLVFTVIVITMIVILALVISSLVI